MVVRVCLFASATLQLAQLVLPCPVSPFLEQDRTHWMRERRDTSAVDQQQGSRRTVVGVAHVLDPVRADAVQVPLWLPMEAEILANLRDGVGGREALDVIVGCKGEHMSKLPPVGQPDLHDGRDLDPPSLGFELSVDVLGYPHARLHEVPDPLPLRVSAPPEFVRVPVQAVFVRQLLDSHRAHGVSIMDHGRVGVELLAFRAEQIDPSLNLGFEFVARWDERGMEMRLRADGGVIVDELREEA